MSTATTTPAAAVARPERARRLGPTARRYLSAFKTARGLIALVLIVVMTVIAFLAPVLFPGGYDAQSDQTLQGISLQHPFGTDELGRDIFVRSIYGLRTDLALVYIAVPITMVLGTFIGLLGFVWKWLGTATQRVLDIILGFPSLILGISVVLVLGSGFVGLLVSIIIIGLPQFGRLARQTMLAQQQREYVTAASTLGIGRWRIMGRHIVPNTVDPVIVQGVVFLVHAVFLEAALSIVGLGIQPPEPSLGALLDTGMRYINQSPTYILGPIIILLLIAFAFTLLTDALNETVNRK
ncbi:ABC transporter permease [Cryocola sp. 340MFSha3.1]|jgi:peptide/nickel transport system permease protein|uniref:ABC transporter permease n=1 Tax=Cryocola sp. 340MFSha3.1 TaxID=1169145 RepID=UPI00037286D8|nr:ABC transporter permease [Cryocola sp. 340MFSha3.1]